MATVTFRFGNQSAYDALKSTGYDSNSLYFIEDTQRLYKGDKLMSEQVIFINKVPEFQDAVADRIYVVKSEDSVSFWVKGDTKMVQAAGGTVSPGSITDVDVFSSDVLTKSTDEPLTNSDEKIPTEGAVKKAIESAVSEVTSTSLGLDDAFIDVKAAAAPEGQTGTVLTFSTKGGTEKKVTIADLFLTDASYDSVSHELTLKVGKDGKEVKVNLEELIPEVVDSTQVKMNYGEPGVLTATVKVGNINAGDKISLTDGDGNIKADTVQAMFEAILSKDVNPTTTQPSASVTLTGAGEKEVGTSFTPSYSATLNPGSYNVEGQGAQATNVTATTYSITDTSEHSASTAKGSFQAFTVSDNTNYQVSATISYGDGAVPKTFLGKPYPDGQIKAGSKSASSSKVTGYRNCWWGFKSSINKFASPETIKATDVKALGNSNKTKPTSFKPTGNWIQLFFAVPKTQASSLSIVGTDSPLPQTVSGPFTVSIGGVGDYSPIDYNVFYVNNAEEAKPDTYKLTWK